MLDDKVDFIAELQYYTPEQGGRKTPARSGYRPHVKFSFSEMLTSGSQEFISQEFVSPGEKVKAKIGLHCPDFFLESLEQGMEFDFREGPYVVGVGVIECIVNSKLKKNSIEKKMA